jgi:isoleucyl-tRNA synthetase
VRADPTDQTDPSDGSDPPLSRPEEPVRALHAAVHQSLEALESRPRVTQPLEAAVTFSVGAADQALLEKYADLLRMFFIVSQVEVVAGETNQVQVSVRQAPGQKCERCWIVTEDVGAAEDHPTLCGRCVEVVRAM